MPNVERLLELRSWVRIEWERKVLGLPSEWNQATWASRRDCGTVCCIAGKAALLEGWRPDFLSRADVSDAFTITFERDGSSRFADELAQEILGLTDQEASHLFRSENTVEQIEELIDKIVDGSYDEMEWQDHLDWDFLADADVRA